MTQNFDLPLPDDCLIRLIDLDPRIGGLTAVDEAGFLNIYLNARLSRDGQRRALVHELRHHWRDDLYSDADIRVVERAADLPSPRPSDDAEFLAIDGTPLDAPAEVFRLSALRRVGRGLYLPEGENLPRAAADVAAASECLMEALHIFDVMQAPPHLPAARLIALAGGLCAGDIAFIAWQPQDRAAELPVAMHIYKEDGGRLRGALYYDARGQVDNALFVIESADGSVTADLRRRRGRLDVFAVSREIGGRYERVY